MKIGWKKVLFLALALCLMLVLAVPALAEGEAVFAVHFDVSAQVERNDFHMLTSVL